MNENESTTTASPDVRDAFERSLDDDDGKRVEKWDPKPHAKVIGKLQGYERVSTKYGDKLGCKARNPGRSRPAARRRRVAVPRRARQEMEGARPKDR